MTIPTVRWPWVLTGERSVRKRPTIPGAPPQKPKAPADNVPLAKMDYFFYHAAFSERIEAGDNIPKPQPKPIVQKELTVEELNTWDMGIRLVLERFFPIVELTLRLVITSSPRVVKLPMRMMNRRQSDERPVQTGTRSEPDTRPLEWNTESRLQKCPPKGSCSTPMISK